MNVNMPEECCKFTLDDLRESAVTNDSAIDRWAVREIERLTAIAAKDEARLRCLAGTYKENDGPVIEGFANVYNDIYCFIGDAIRKRIGEENDSLDVEPTNDDMLAGMRAMIDASIEAEKARAT